VLAVRHPRSLTTVLTIGHSNHSLPRFLSLLSLHGVTAVADVRSRPYSRRFPWFNRNRLSESLPGSGIAYVFLGDLLGGRPEDRSCYVDGQVQYALVARAPFFLTGVARLLEGAASYLIAVMCAEKDPLTCHRTLLVARQLALRGVSVSHILATGELESQAAADARLVEELKLGGLLGSPEETIEEAYRRRAARVAFTRLASKDALPGPA
jgi:uncharacterized protein (DUF488 family)